MNRAFRNRIKQRVNNNWIKSIFLRTDRRVSGLLIRPMRGNSLGWAWYEDHWKH